MAKLTDTTRVLTLVPLFQNLPRTVLQQIASTAKMRTATADEVLCKQGEPGSEFFVILSGTAQVARIGRAVGEITGGQWFGELSLLDRGIRTATVTAKSEMTLLVFDESQFTQLIDEIPTIAHLLLAALAAKLRHLEAELDRGI